MDPWNTLTCRCQRCRLFKPLRGGYRDTHRKIFKCADCLQKAAKRVQQQAPALAPA